MTQASEKKDVQKLQRVVVDSLEDIKAVDIVVFNTEHLSALFERVIIASGTSNRQTKALAAHLRDEVREAGFDKPRIEGEENGEWIIVDCGTVVVHIMQPTIRQYYQLEEIWGEKPVRIKLGAAAPRTPAKSQSKSATTPAAKKVAPTKSTKSTASVASKSSKTPTAAKKSSAKSTATGKSTARKSRA